MYAANFRDLVVYQKARSVAKNIFTVSKRFPREEMYSLTDQLTVSSEQSHCSLSHCLLLTIHCSLLTIN